MKIAILGWGSLIWNSQNLRLLSDENNTIWIEEGILLPIEFARISNDGRLTLVIKPKAKNVKTLFAISSFENLDEAILDLTIRENCGRNKIGYAEKKSKTIFPSNLFFEQKVWTWLTKMEEIDAVLWTNLSPNFKDKMGKELSIESAINYLKNLPLDANARAEEYIRKAPESIDTPIRREVIKQLNWNNIS